MVPRYLVLLAIVPSICIASSFWNYNRRRPPLVSINLNQRDVLNRSVRVAAREGKLEILRKAIEKGGDIDSQADNGATALMNASGACFPVVVKFLLKKGAEINVQDSKGRTALMLASRAVCLPVVKLLLNYSNLNIRLKDQAGKSALDIAKSTASLETDGPSLEIVKKLKKTLKKRRKDHAKRISSVDQF